MDAHAAPNRILSVASIVLIVETKHKEIQMPTILIEAPTGIRADAKRRLVEKTTVALDEAYHIPDVRIFLREYQADNVAQDGRLQSEPVRPVCFVEAPQLRSLDAKRKLIEKIDAAVAEAYEGIANTGEILILHNEYPLENAGWAGRLQSDNPEVVEALKKLNG
jgi:phenylpyruvate tautomerase PptA (4-oxalocrotonate tautomerase family)